MIGGYDYYNRQQPYYRQPTYPYSQQYYQRYPYNQQYYGQEYNNVPYVFGYPPPQTSSYHQNAFGYTNSPSYDAIAIRQAPVYPSPGAQPIGPPVPHPFYHTPGTYYPNEIVTVKPAVPADPKKYARWKTRFLRFIKIKIVQNYTFVNGDIRYIVLGITKLNKKHRYSWCMETNRNNNYRYVYENKGVFFYIAYFLRYRRHPSTFDDLL